MPHLTNKKAALIKFSYVLLALGLVGTLLFRSQNFSGDKNPAPSRKQVAIHRAEIWDIKFSPDGSCIASGSIDSTAKITRTADGKVMQVLRHPIGVTAVAFSPDGQWQASAGDDARIYYWPASRD
jgi:WD40 repeat protein